MWRDGKVIRSYLFSLYSLAMAALVIVWLIWFYFLVVRQDWLGIAFWIIITSGLAFVIMYFPKKIQISRKP